MRLLSWNVNGIRAVIRKGFFDFLKKEKPAVLCLQEIKISEEARKKEFPQTLNGEHFLTEYGYSEYWNSAKRPGYSGTLILVKKELAEKVLSYKKGLGIKKFDKEGRTQTIEFKNFYLVNNYFPNSNQELSRLDYKIEYNQKLHKYLKKLEKKKSVIVTGDFNVAHNEIDLAHPKDNIGNPGFTKEERGWMSDFLDDNFVDTFRKLHPKTMKYSWWSYRMMARERNIGWRLDYFIVSKKFQNKIQKSEIHDEIMGSDHCPVSVDIKT